MKIEVNETQKQYRFSDLKIGDFFQIKDAVMMKIKEILFFENKETGYILKGNCVCICNQTKGYLTFLNGTVNCLTENTKVSKIENPKFTGDLVETYTDTTYAEKKADVEDEDDE